MIEFRPKSSHFMSSTHSSSFDIFEMIHVTRFRHFEKQTRLEADILEDPIRYLHHNI